jgi:hypothetical protein
MTHRKGPSPLFEWKVVFIVTAVAGIVMLLYDPMRTIRQRRDDAVLKQVSTIQFHSNQRGVIFFGNSLMNLALPPQNEILTKELLHPLRKEGFPKSVSVVKVATGGLSAWRLRDLGGLLIRTRPSMIVLQSEMCVSRKGKRQEPPEMKNRIGVWSGVLSLQLFGKGLPVDRRKPPNQLFETKQKPPSPRSKRERALASARNLWSNQTASTGTREYQISRNFVERASEVGILVVILELPVSHTAAELATDEYLKARTSALEELSKAGALHLRYPIRLPDEYFADYSHLNIAGQKKFNRWLFPALAQVLVRLEKQS